MKRRQAGMAVAFALLGCDKAPAGPSPIEREARAALNLSLNDEPSARLQQVRAVVSPLDGKTTFICGLVNAKNQMAAYTGWRRFVMQRGTTSVVISPDATDNSPRDEMAAQGAFESVYPTGLCPTNGYAPSGLLAAAVKAVGREQPRTR